MIKTMEEAKRWPSLYKREMAQVQEGLRKRAALEADPTSLARRQESPDRYGSLESVQMPGLFGLRRKPMMERK